MKVIGLHTCSCHLFKDYEEAKKYKNQKLPIGTTVKNRCCGKEGVVIELCEQKGYVLVKYGSQQKDIHLEHVQELVKTQSKTTPYQSSLLDLIEETTNK